jgi:hypothetical protein
MSEQAPKSGVGDEAAKGLEGRQKLATSFTRHTLRRSHYQGDMGMFSAKQIPATSYMVLFIPESHWKGY